MEYDYRNRARPPYDSQTPTNRPGATTGAMYTNPNYYPRVGQPGSYPVNPPPARNPPFIPPHPPSSSPGIGIRVSLKPEYRITPPPMLSPLIGEIPRSNFLFDFEFERKILAEAEKDGPNWSRLGQENPPPRTPETTSSSTTPDPVVNKYIASGINRDVATVAVANYGDNPTKVREFASGYAMLLEMGFSPNSVVEALLMHDNDISKASAFCVSGSSH